MNNYKCPYDHDQLEFRLEWYEENFEKLLVALSDALSWSPSDNRKYTFATLNIPTEFRLEWYEENFEKLLVALSDALSWSPSDNRWCPPDNRKYILAALNIPNEGHTK